MKPIQAKRIAGLVAALSLFGVGVATIARSHAKEPAKRAPASAALPATATAGPAELPSVSLGQPTEDLTRFRSACTKGEWWGFSTRIEPAWREGFQEFLGGKMSPVRGFSEGMALRTNAKNDESKLFGEYWASRALFDADLPHIAHVGFSSIASRDVSGVGKIVQIAALQCLLEINRKLPTLGLTPGAAERLFTLPKNTVTYEAAGQLVRVQIGSGRPDAEIDRTLRYLEGGAAHHSLAMGLWAASRNRHAETITWLTNFFQDSQPSGLRRFHDPARLILARAYFTTKQYDLGANEWKLMQKSSNELSHALSELAWAYLKGEKYQEAVGTATNLQAGGLKNTFAPEAPMIMAMAFNELCYFPESLKAMQQLKADYAATYTWLMNWEKLQKSGKGPNLYHVALAHLRRIPGKVPARIGNEWVRSSLFLSRQDEINALFSERRNIQKLGNEGAKEARRLAVQLVKLIREVKPFYLEARATTPPEQPLPDAVEFELKKVRKVATAYRRLRRGAEPWKRILAYFDRQAPGMEAKLVKEVDSDLVRMNQRMLVQLAEVADNTRFIEVEIFNGASQDMVWQNAHPDYREVSKKIEEETKAKPNRAAVWDWGTVSEGSAAGQEIWEDELGSYRADLTDNCTNHEKYLALKRLSRVPAGEGGSK
jgi:hypothetical protein